MVAIKSHSPFLLLPLKPLSATDDGDGCGGGWSLGWVRRACAREGDSGGNRGSDQISKYIKNNGEFLLCFSSNEPD